MKWLRVNAAIIAIAVGLIGQTGWMVWRAAEDRTLNDSTRSKVDKIEGQVGELREDVAYIRGRMENRTASVHVE